MAWSLLVSVMSFALTEVFCGEPVTLSRPSREGSYSYFPAGRAEKFWTQWYNTDNPSNFGGDDETLQSIRKRGWEVCPGYNIVAAQCRKVGSRTLFSENTYHQYSDLDAFYRPCTTGGLHCRNEDQANGQTCSDYEIRFQCKSGSVSDEAVYTWVAVLAVVFLIVPIAWVILVNVKRKYCPSARGPGEDNSDTERGAVSTVSDPSVTEPPPSYDTLFGGGSPLGSNVFDFGSTSALLENEIQRTAVSQNASRPSRRDTNSNDNPALSSGSEQSNAIVVNQSNPRVSLNPNPPSTDIPQVHRSHFQHPGMHLPVFPFMRQISDSQQTPPPTYDDAIIKLGVPLPMKKDPS